MKARQKAATGTIGPSAQTVSIYQKIRQDIEDRILSGEWEPGYRIPFERDLLQTYNCSRMTVNKALNELARKGLIERRRKAGSYVSAPHSQSAVLEIRDIRAEVEALGLPYRYQLLSRRVRAASASVIDQLGLSPGQNVLELVCLHHAGQRPFCLEERFINLQAVPGAADEPFDDLAPGPWLLRYVSWSSAEHTMRATGADAAAARALDLPVGYPCLVVERKTHHGGAYVTYVRLTYPGDRHEMIATFTPSAS